MLSLVDLINQPFLLSSSDSRNRKFSSSISMGFPCLIYSAILPKPVVIFIELLDLLQLVISAALSYVGLSSARNLSDFELSPIDLTAAFNPAEIKRLLPVVSYARFLQINGGDADGRCAVCLGVFDAADVVRELGNCSHVFHRGCVDKWIDLCRSSCPLVGYRFYLAGK